jgi:hypothetical protein
LIGEAKPQAMPDVEIVEFGLLNDFGWTISKTTIVELNLIL